VSASAPGGTTVVSLGTATPGGGFPVYGGAVAETINETDPTLDVPRQSRGAPRCSDKGAAPIFPLDQRGEP
jgi:hypothetical protein